METLSFGSSTPAKQLQSISMYKVRVIVRVRPFLPHEINAKGGNPKTCVSILDREYGSGEEVAVHLKDHETSRNECYKLDSFFGQEEDNVSQIFHKEVSPLIQGIFQGCSATVFAYGATGSGKTHTMQGTEEHPGLMPLAMSTIMLMCNNTRSTIEISYYEVYMDRCYDLLEPKAKEISVLEDKDGHIQLRGLSRVPVDSMSEFHQVFSSGIQRRKVAHTGLNDVSSRSHGVLVIVVSTPCSDGSGAVITGKINLIDLAGNEDNRRTCNEGIRLQESAKINQSLFALSNVIYALNNNKPRVPYRESKLTRILQDSLGGTSCSLLVACLNPGEYQESINTVSLAARSRQITNYISSAQDQDTPKEKVDMEAKLRAWLESKGKTKSTQKMGTFVSPVFSKTPTSVRSISKLNLYLTSAKDKSARSPRVSLAKERNGLNAGGLCVPFINDTCFKKVEGSKDCIGFMKDDGSTNSKYESFEDHATAPPYDHDNNAQLNHSMDCSREKNSSEEELVETNGISMLESTSHPYGRPQDNSDVTMQSTNVVKSPCLTDHLKALQNSVRKALSPINYNMKTLNDLSSKDGSCLASFELKTPVTPYVLKSENIDAQTANTPLDTFNTRSSGLKSSLVQEYLAVLNSASKEELLGLKGIGQKRAEYICELRETSPLKSLSDLEKIGLSSKQVYGMFKRTASGIFD